MLIVLDTPGLVVCHQWSKFADHVGAVKQAIIADTQSDEESLEKLAVLEGTYVQGGLTSEDRMVLSYRVLAHLGVDPGTRPIFHVIAYPAKFEICSNDFWNQRVELAEFDVLDLS